MVNIDDLGFFRNDYDRPKQKWICGRSEKLPCQLGPDSNGNCRTSFECVPVNISGKWVCTRPDILGGPCKTGPSTDGTCAHKTEKCKPVKNVRSARGNLTWIMFIISFLVISGIFFSGYRYLIVKPGGVSKDHSYLNTKCQECHVSAYLSVGEWALSVIKKKEIDEDYITCLKCHSKRPYVTSPHNLSTESLKSIHISRKENKQNSFEQKNKPTENVEDKIFCSDCHKEHQGTNHDLLKFEDMKCMTCHEAESKEENNHEFTERPSNIVNKNIRMNHESHFNTHFKSLLYSAFVPKDCKECHILKRDTGYISTRDYSVMCMKCHDNQVLDSFSEKSSKGIPVFAVPGIDIKTLNSRKVFIGYWPNSGQGHNPMGCRPLQNKNCAKRFVVQEGISPFMKFLLSAEPQNADALNAIAGLNLLNLSRADDSQLQAVKKLAWAIKELLYEISTKGHQALTAKIQKAAGKRIDNEQLAMLSELLPMELFQQSVQEWFGTVARKPALKPEKISSEEWVSTGGWYSDKFAIYYRPAGHKDRFIFGWLNLATSIGIENQTEPVAEIFRALFNPKSPGVCSKCHAITSNENSRDIYWGKSNTVNKKLNFLKFSHLPHSTVSSGKGCKFCHKLPPEGKNMESNAIIETNPIDFVSIKMSTCIGCHVKIDSGDNCLNCHIYHVKEL